MSARRTLHALLLASLLVAPLRVSAQTRMTILAGVALSRIEGADEAEFEQAHQRRGLNVQITADIPLLGSTLAISPGGAYIDKGLSFEPAGTESSLRLSYVELVSPLRVDFSVAGPVGLSLYGGPGVGISMGCQYKQTNPTGSISSFDCSNSDFDFKTLDVVGIAGAGLSYRLAGDTRVLLSGGMDTSLVSVRANDDLKHRSWVITAGASYVLQQGRR